MLTMLMNIILLISCKHGERLSERDRLKSLEHGLGINMGKNLYYP